MRLCGVAITDTLLHINCVTPPLTNEDDVVSTNSISSVIQGNIGSSSGADLIYEKVALMLWRESVIINKSCWKVSSLGYFGHVFDLDDEGYLPILNFLLLLY